MIDTAKRKERAVLVGIITRDQPREKLDEYLDELAFLAETADAICLKRFTQSLDHPDNKTFVGSGKLKEIKQFVEEEKPELLIFDDELSPSQLRNLEKEFLEKGVKIVDRNNLVARGQLRWIG